MYYFILGGVVHSALTHWPLNQFVIEQAVQTDWTEQIQERIDENPDFRAWVEEFQRRRGLAS